MGSGEYNGNACFILQKSQTPSFYQVKNYYGAFLTLKAINS